MEFWKIRIRLVNNSVLFFVSERGNVREFLGYYWDRGLVDSVFVSVKYCFGVEDLGSDNWDSRFVCYRNSKGILVWEDLWSFESYCERKKVWRNERGKEREIKIDFG